MSDNKENTKWWEKTVEYKFVIENQHNLKLIAPLDGNQEKYTSDAIAGDGNKFILIEFKVDCKSQSSEFKKFLKEDGFSKESEDKLIEDLEHLSNNKSHFIVYAELKDSKLELVYQTYVNYLKKVDFSNADNEDSKSTFKKMIDNGVNLKEFKDYLSDFKKLREKYMSDNSSDSSSSGFDNVLVLDKDGNCCSLKEFENLNKTLDLSKSSTNENSQKVSLPRNFKR